MNEPTAKLAAALVAVQADLPDIERDRTVTVEPKDPKKPPYSYSYVTLATLSKAILPLLAKHGLAFAAMPSVGSDGKMALLYHLLHTSGESLSGEFPISGEGGIQMIGGRISYSRRYCLAALVGVAADEDDESRLAGDERPVTAQRAATRPAKAAGKPAGRTAQRGRAGPPPLPSDAPAGWTPAQRAAIMAGFTKAGVGDRDERLDLSSRAVGRRLATANELTQEEAATLIQVLDAAGEQQDPGVHLRAAVGRLPLDDDPAKGVDPAGDPPTDPGEVQ